MNNFAQRAINDFKLANGCKSKSPIFACYIDDFNPGEDYATLKEIDFSLHADSTVDIYNADDLKQYFFEKHSKELCERPINILVLDRELKIHNRPIFLGDLMHDSEYKNELNKLNNSNSCSFEDFISTLRKNEDIELKLDKSNEPYKAITLNIK